MEKNLNANGFSGTLGKENLSFLFVPSIPNTKNRQKIPVRTQVQYEEAITPASVFSKRESGAKMQLVEERFDLFAGVTMFQTIRIVPNRSGLLEAVITSRRDLRSQRTAAIRSRSRNHLPVPLRIPRFRTCECFVPLQRELGATLTATVRWWVANCWLHVVWPICWLWLFFFFVGILREVVLCFHTISDVSFI